MPSPRLRRALASLAADIDRKLLAQVGAPSISPQVSADRCSCRPGLADHFLRLPQCAVTAGKLAGGACSVVTAPASAVTNCSIHFLRQWQLTCTQETERAHEQPVPGTWPAPTTLLEDPGHCYGSAFSMLIAVLSALEDCPTYFISNESLRRTTPPAVSRLLCVSSNAFIHDMRRYQPLCARGALV